MENLNKKLCSYINGEYLQPSDNDTSFPNINPANNEELNLVYPASKRDLDDAIMFANRAFDVWSVKSTTERSDILLKAARLLREQSGELARMEVYDTGKPIAEAASFDIATGADTIEYFAKAALAFEGKSIPNNNALIYTRHEPLGVCVGIGAWNYPIQIACWKAAPALITGNTMVYKPSEMTPMTTLKLAEIFIQAGVPAGVFNVVLGGADVAEALLSMQGIAKVSFTGSVPTGKKVAMSAAKQLIPATLELGGKSPLIIFEDADLDEAVYGAMLANFYTQGEICSNGTRVFVHERVANDFLEKLHAQVAQLKIGDPFDPATQIGALISKQHMEKVIQFIEQGKEQGARLVCGGRVVTASPMDKGNYIEPTIFADCHDDMNIVKEEIFGPVLSLLTFTTEEEVIKRANNTNFGLAAGLFTADVKKAHRVATRLQAGVCWVNNYNVTPASMPFGGYKQSGLGRENGFETLNHYTKTKSIYIELKEIEHPY